MATVLRLCGSTPAEMHSSKHVSVSRNKGCEARFGVIVFIPWARVPIPSLGMVELKQFLEQPVLIATNDGRIIVVILLGGGLQRP
jgi:hypothetical protein